jgi:Methyl-accepting chemotaxis protein
MERRLLLPRRGCGVVAARHEPFTDIYTHWACKGDEMQRWSDLRVKTKFYFGLAILSVIMSICTGLFIFTLYSLSDAAKEMSREANLNQSFISRQVQHLQWVNNLSKYLLEEGKEELKVAKDPAQCGFGKWYYSDERYDVMKTFPALESSLLAIEPAHKALHATSGIIQDLTQSGKLAEARNVFDNETLPALKEVEKHLASLSASLDSLNNAAQEGFIERANSSLILTLVLGALGLSAVGALAFIVYTSFLKPVQALRAYAEECKAGREAKAPLNSKDELGVLSTIISELISHLGRELALSQGVLRGLSVPCSIFSAEDTTLFTNQCMLDLIERGGKPEDCIGMSSGEYIWGDRNKETLSTQALRENRVLEADLEFTTHKGNMRYATVSSSPFRDQHGVILGTVSVWMDMTEIVAKQRMEESSKRIADIVVLATGVAHSVSSSSVQLSAQVEEASRGAAIQRDRMTETFSATTQMSASALQVAHSASIASATAAEARDQAQEGARTMERVVDSIAAVGARANEMKVGMGNLGRQAEGIGAIINVITDIADQTNLLALNAAIEAARAGDAGRGFAVVADEVRKLAEKTMNATREVREVISGIQKGTHVNVQSVDLAAQAISETSSLADEAGASLKNIVSLVESTSSQIHSIAVAAEEQTAVTQEINQSLEDVSRISDETSTVMQESTKAVEELAVQAENLRVLIDRLQE